MDPLRRIRIDRKLALARELRLEPTSAERYAWSLLRNRQLLGLKFRRQHVLHGLIVDFYCVAQKLVVEIEGVLHQIPAQAAYDAARADVLQSAGYRVVRIRAGDLSPAHLEERIRHALRKDNSPEVPPLPKGEGDRG